MTAATPPYRFTKRHRLRTQSEFDVVYRRRIARTAGPLRVFGRPNGLSHSRLGLNVSRRVGHAVRRNRVKRMLREAFRLTQQEWPGAYDVIVVARPHEPLSLEEYIALLRKAVEKVDRHFAGEACAG